MSQKILLNLVSSVTSNGTRAVLQTVFSGHNFEIRGSSKKFESYF